MSDARRLDDKLWSYCNVLRDDGVGTIEYTEQLTYLLFLKMAHERETVRSTLSGSCPRAVRGKGSWMLTVTILRHLPPHPGGRHCSASLTEFKSTVVSASRAVALVLASFLADSLRTDALP